MGTTTIHPAERAIFATKPILRLYMYTRKNADACSLIGTGVIGTSRPAKGQKIMHSQIGQASSRYTIPRKNRRRIRTGNYSVKYQKPVWLATYIQTSAS